MSQTALHSTLHPVSQPIAMFQQFIATESQTIVLKEKILSLSGDSFDIKLENGDPLLTVDGNRLSPSGRKKVLDPNGTRLFDLRKEHFHLHTTYVMEDLNGDKICEVRSSHKRKRYLLGSRSIEHDQRSILVVRITNDYSHRFQGYRHPYRCVRQVCDSGHGRKLE